MSAALAALVACVLINASTDVTSPPRYDGAGYCVLARAIYQGKGYTDISSPVEKPHGHFPPAYPFVLAGLYRIPRLFVIGAHLLSIVCTTLAVWVASRWFLTIEPAKVAVPLSFGLAVNWTWMLNGGMIQSEPLFLLLSMLTLMVARRTGAWASLALGLLLGASILTRHVGACLASAVICYQCLNKRWRDSLITAGVAALVVSPWVVWVIRLEGRTQAGLFQREGLLELIGSQALFYARRIPDALAGPFIEVATVFTKSRVIGLVANVGAVAVSSVIIVGCVKLLAVKRRRLAGLTAIFTLMLLLVWPFTEAGRFLMPIVPLLLLGAVEGLNSLLKHYKFIRKSQIAWIMLVISIPYPAYALISGRAAAARATHDEFDSACQWFRLADVSEGPVMTRHPGEVYLKTGLKSVEPASTDIEQVLRQVDEQKVTYLLVDPNRFANAPETPLAELIRIHPERFIKVHAGKVEVYKVRREHVSSPRFSLP